ncbi:MAG: phosphonate ABC transporter, permease protein PhnE [Deltaproteobacteria bacterium]|nr:phosphonate ABC transporter, permease protein PhnE [Deltaproteobacteria bacterium]
MTEASYPLPNRFERPSVVSFALYIFIAWFVVVSFSGAGISLSNFIEGIPNMGTLLSEMFPPKMDRLGAIGKALLETFQMAIGGTILGVILSVPLGVFASRTQSPHVLVYRFTRLLISFFRSVPDLVWALFFVATVGLGPFAGTLALMIDTIGFCARFFAEAIEEINSGPQEALTAIGANRTSRLFCSVFPAAMPSFTNTAMYSLEKATRSSVVLGLVGAGGIGIELKVSMDMFRYAEASTIILFIFLLVVAVETLSTKIRQKLM